MAVEVKECGEEENISDLPSVEIDFIEDLRSKGRNSL